MNKVDSSAVGRQVHLPLSRAFKISLDSIKIRFWRSTITAGGTFLGIAFLASVLAQGLMQWPVPTNKIGTGLVRLDGEFTTPGDFEAWKPATIAEAKAAGIPDRVIEWVASPDGKVSVRGIALRVERLEREKTKLAVTTKKADALRKLPKSLVEGADDKKIKVKDLKRAGLDGQIIKELTAGADMNLVDFKAAMQKVYDKEAQIKAAIEVFKPFGFDKSKLVALEEKKAYTLGEVLATAKQATKKADTHSLKMVNFGGRAFAFDMNKNQKELASVKVQSGDLVTVPDASEKARRTWLAIMSLLVCTVGIMNSMLMSVTERFKEIGTMKCLGALNKFVVELLVLEAGMMGFVASFLGWFVGVGIVTLLAVLTKGFVILRLVSGIDSLILFGVSMGVGMFLTMFAAIWPAIRAARMPAAMALRSEI